MIYNELKYQITKKQLEKIIKEVNMKVSEKEINYIETMCSLLINTLKDFNNECKENTYVFSSPNRAKFDRLRLELNKELIKVKKEVYR